MIRFVILLCFICSALAGAVSPSAAQIPKDLGGTGKWTAYTFMDGKNKVCYMASAPVKQQGKYKNRDQPYALITNRPASKSKAEVNFVAGYTFKKDAPVKVTVGNQTFELFSTEGRAWSPDARADAKLVKAMIRGSRMVVRGVASRGTKTTDSYSLSGFTATKKLIDRACKPK
ncbi:MAG: invasion associated locus B family protein [Proteobacteria bacterium]|nr:invasion associated locus B family protein [Pseudomonadota bacterium]